jgi:hypothetical protein
MLLQRKQPLDLIVNQDRSGRARVRKTSCDGQSVAMTVHSVGLSELLRTKPAKLKPRRSHSLAVSEKPHRKQALHARRSLPVPPPLCLPPGSLDSQTVDDALEPPDVFAEASPSPDAGSLRRA